MMKKTIFLIFVFLSATAGYGQQTLELLLKARALTEAGKPELAITLLSGALDAIKDSRLYTERAEAFLLKRDYSGAISDYNEANSLTPLSGEYGLSRTYALKGDAATSVYHLEIAMKSPDRKAEKEIVLDPAFSKVENRPEWRQFWKKEWYSAADRNISEIEYYLSAGKTDQAKEVFAELKKDYDSDADILYAGALISLSSGNYQEAVKDASALADQNQQNEKYLRILAKAQSGISDPAGASVTYTRMINSGVIDAGLYLLRADCYRKTGEDDKALNDINKYLEFYPENKEALSLAGREEAKSGDNLKALEFFSRNLELHPNDPECY